MIKEQKVRTYVFGKVPARRISFAVGLALLATMSLGAWYASAVGGGGAPKPVLDADFDYLTPSSVDGMARFAEIIVVGRITEIESVETLYPTGYDPNDEKWQAPSAQWGIPLTYLRVEVIEYVKGEGPKTLTLVHTGDLINTDGYIQIPRPAFDEPTLMFLFSGSPRDDSGLPIDNQWGTVHGSESLLTAEDGTISRSLDGVRMEVSEFAGMSVSQAAVELRRLLPEYEAARQ